MLIVKRSDKFEFVKKRFLTPGYAIFTREFITKMHFPKGIIAKAFLFVLMIGISLFLIDSSTAKANNLPEAHGVASAEMKSSTPIETRVGERTGVAEPNRFAGLQLEPLMLFLLGTMLLSIGAVIKFAGTRNHR